MYSTKLEIILQAQINIFILCQCRHIPIYFGFLCRIIYTEPNDTKKKKKKTSKKKKKSRKENTNKTKKKKERERKEKVFNTNIYESSLF